MPDFHPEGIRTYLTSYALPAPPELDQLNYTDRNPREAPPFALHEHLRDDKHPLLSPPDDADNEDEDEDEDDDKDLSDDISTTSTSRGIRLPCYDSNHLPIKHVQATADPGAPLQVHFMVWSQQVVHDMDLPAGEDEFLDLRVELSIDGHIVDVAYVSHIDIKPNGLPVGVEFVGERCGDAKELPMFFTTPAAKGGKELEETLVNVLVTLGRIGGYTFYDKNKLMSKMVRVAAVHGKYESSTTSKGFNGYVWRKEHQNLIRDRAINPRTRLFAWRSQSVQNDLYRLQLQRRAYERCAREWEELERNAEMEGRTEGGVTEGGDEVSAPLSIAKRIKLAAAAAIGSTASSGAPVLGEAEGSPYSFRRPRRSDAMLASATVTQSSASVSPASDSTKRSGATVVTTTTMTTEKKKKACRVTTKANHTATVERGDGQRGSQRNVTFGAVPFKTTRQYFRDFVAYKDLCRIEYQICEYIFRDPAELLSWIFRVYRG
ncbi:hypothetical protein DRE_05160 [Drechslerella stenobrocha 248]|uniref:Uncharacterized protein n=1 Tax=Drechslerella stenobrocha 248 TaxID=1043628 RepID=W7I0R3_9PEZI|nr:hypothetical protein DRE_05160 [Drechslerella stenobrocha 248]